MRSDIDRAVDAWRQHGFAILPTYIPADDLAPAAAELPLLYPTADEYHDRVDPDRNSRFDDEFGGIDDFPFPGTGLSLLAVHPMLIDLAERLLGTANLRVYSIEAWAKYTGAADYDQHLHRDYLGATLLVPSTDLQFGQVEMFLYLEDIPVELGPPSFVATRHTDDLPMISNWFPREDGARDPDQPTWISPLARPDLYEREVRAPGPSGTVAAYTNRTFHRATRLTAPRGARYTLHVNFRPAGCDWQNRHSWVGHGNTPAWSDFVERASPRQLALFGWPLPGHPFWTAQTVAAIGQRHPGLDVAPWSTALSESSQLPPPE
jgi:Phytanoyl-CoA dioxygenase (PhyH)